MTDSRIEEALVQPSRSISIVWLLPLIALMIGGWLLYKSVIDAPIPISIEFSSGTGIEIGKTRVVFDGLPVGVVRDMRLDPTDLKGVIATVEMNNSTTSFLREGTQFWLVKPEISLSGITGLETIVSGNYITLRANGEGAATRHFVALNEPPAVDMSEPGLHLKLLANELGSVHAGAPLLYKKIVVGRVLDYELDTARDKVVISVIVQQPYDTLIRQKTRFWNTSGVRVKAGLDGVDVQMDSLLTLVQGGISFDVPEEKSPAASNGDTFDLYRDYASAQRGVQAVIRFNASDQIPAKGAKIQYRGFEAGVVRSLQLSDDHGTVEARVSMAPEMEEHLTSGTRFWLVKPQISLQGVSGLDTLVKGTYVEMDIGAGESMRDFVALREAPLLDARKPGLRLQLETAELGSVNVGSPVLYRKMPVGAVEKISLLPRQDRVMISIRIEPEYRSLVNSETRFWNASGVQFSGSFSKVLLRTESLTSLLQGGVAFYNPQGSKGKPVSAGSRFNLYEDYESAQENGLRIDILLNNADGVGPGTAIRYQGIEIGSIKSVQLKPDLSGIVASAILQVQPERFARQGSRYWLVQPKLSITGAANLETLVTGKYFEVLPGTGQPQRRFDGEYEAPVQLHKDEGLNLVLIAPRLGSVREGLSVYYREVAVGRVTGYRLADTADQVQIFVNIQPRYAPLVRDGSVFWNASGISVDVGLFKGAKIRTESLESILAGGIAFATPNEGSQQSTAHQGAHFRLHADVKPEWLKWKPRIALAPDASENHGQ